MRCFVAVELPEEIKAELVKAQKALQSVEGLEAKFVEESNLHLTLKFLGELSESGVAKIKEKLSTVKFKPLQVSLGGLGTFPSESYVRVIWISLEPSDKFIELSKSVNRALGSSDKRFESHVTLARVKAVRDKGGLQRKLKEIRVEKKTFELNSFTLKESTLTREGPVYEDIKEFNF